VGDGGTGEVPDRVAVLGERVGAALAVVLRVLARVRLLPVVGHVLVHDHVIVRVGQAVRARSLQVDGRVRNGRLVVLVGLEARVELVAGGGEVGDADDLARRARGVVALAPVDHGPVTLERGLVHQQTAALRVRDARVGRSGGRLGDARGRNSASVLVVHRRPGEGGEAGGTPLVDETTPPRAPPRPRAPRLAPPR